MIRSITIQKSKLLKAAAGYTVGISLAFLQSSSLSLFNTVKTNHWRQQAKAKAVSAFNCLFSGSSAAQLHSLFVGFSERPCIVIAQAGYFIEQSTKVQAVPGSYCASSGFALKGQTSLVNSSVAFEPNIFKVIGSQILKPINMSGFASDSYIIAGIARYSPDLFPNNQHTLKNPGFTGEFCKHAWTNSENSHAGFGCNLNIQVKKVKDNKVINIGRSVRHSKNKCLRIMT